MGLPQTRKAVPAPLRGTWYNATCKLLRCEKRENPVTFGKGKTIKRYHKLSSSFFDTSLLLASRTHKTIRMADSKTVLDHFLDNVERFGDNVWMTQPMGGGNANVKTFTFNETLAEAKKIAGYIDSLGLPPKSQIAICSKNCAWWVIADLGIWISGHVSVPVFPTLTAETTKYTLDHSEAKVVFVGKLDEKPWLEQKKGIADDIPTISFPLCPKDAAKKTWEEACKEATPLETPVKRTLDEMATIIYTSGSTGK